MTLWSGRDESLAAALASAHAALREAPDGHLERPFRVAVLGALGPSEPDRPPARAALLALEPLVRRALPAWQLARPADARPDDLLSAALGPVADAEALADAAGDFFHEVNDGFIPDLPDEAACAASAAIGLLLTACWGFRSEHTPDDAGDDDLDPETWDPEYWAAYALVGWVPEERVDERRALWTWWLDEVVPAAAQAGSRPG